MCFEIVGRKVLQRLRQHAVAHGMGDDVDPVDIRIGGQQFEELLKIGR